MERKSCSMVLQATERVMKQYSSLSHCALCEPPFTLQSDHFTICAA